MFFVKKVIGAFLTPTAAGMTLLFLGVVLLWLGKRPRLARIAVTIGAVVLAIASLTLVSDPLVRRLEWTHAPAQVTASSEPGPWIVVLGGGVRRDPSLPPTGRLNVHLLARVVEGVRLHRLLPGSRLLFSGFGPAPGWSSAEASRDAAVALGVDPSAISVEPRPRDTEEEAELIVPILGGRPFYLVTSATHLPRAIGLFRGRGGQPIAAPADYELASHDELTFWDFTPSGESLARLQHASHEVFGTLWSRLRGRL